jgi:hypothetical protein
LAEKFYSIETLHPFLTSRRHSCSSPDWPSGLPCTLGGRHSETGVAKFYQPGTDVMILEIFSLKKIAKKMVFFTQNKAKLCKIMIITLVFEKNANFFAENCQKSQKIVIITSTPGMPQSTYVQSRKSNPFNGET